MNCIKDVVANRMCSGCGACVSSCPKNAIEVKSTNIGRLYASIDHQKCIKCGICERICPSTDYTYLNISKHVKNKEKTIGDIINIYVGHSTNNRIYNNAQSGGAVTQILYSLLSSKEIDVALICKTESGRNGNHTFVTLVTDPERLFATQRSFYSPISILSSLVNVRNFKKVAIVGCPCQIQGITSLQSNNLYKNVFLKIGLVCDRCISSACDETILKFIDNRKDPNSTYKITYRDKHRTSGTNAYRYAKMNITKFSDNKEPVEFIKGNEIRLYLKDYYTPPRCYTCQDKLNTFADIVCGDPWGMSNVDWENGDSLIISRTILGESIIERLLKNDDLILQKAKVEEMLNGQKIEERRLQLQAISKSLNELGLAAPIWLQSYPEMPTNKKIEELKKYYKHIISRYFNLEEMNREELTNKVKNEMQIHFLKERIVNKLYGILNVK